MTNFRVPSYLRARVSKCAAVWTVSTIAALHIAGCDSRQQPDVSVSQAAKPTITPEKRAEAVKSATAGMTEERDKMESISFFSAKDEQWTDTGITVYLSVPDTTGPFLRVVPHYHGESWIFFDSVKVMADGKIVYEKSLASLRTKRDNNASGVYESFDYAAEPEDLAAVREISNAKSVTVRLAGEKREDVDLSPAAIARMKRALAAYDALATL